MFKKKYLIIFSTIIFFASHAYSASYVIPSPYAGYGYSSGTYGTAFGANFATLTYTNTTAGYAGIGVALKADWGVINLNPYLKISFDVSGNSAEADILIKEFDGSQNGIESTKFTIKNIQASALTHYEVALSNFTGVNKNNIQIIQFMPTTLGTNKSITIKNISFDDTPVSSNLKTLLVDVLISGNYIASNKYLPLTSTTNYKLMCSNLWNGYKTQFITNYSGIANASVYGLVFDPYTGTSTTTLENSDYTTSEATGYGLLLALYHNDQTVFDSILTTAWTKLYKGSTGLLSWKLGANGSVLDANSATDADQDIALALIFADTLVKKSLWANTGNNYNSKAQGLIDAIYKNDFEYYRYLRPGDYNYGGRTATNPSYFSPAWYRIFDQFETTDHDWPTLIDLGYNLIASTNGYAKGLAPDWCNAWGQPSEFSYYTYNLQKEAVRVYWRLGVDSVWFNEPRANTFLNKTKTVFKGFGGNITPNAVTYLTMSGISTGNFTDISLVGMFTAGAMADTSTNYKAVWKNTFDTYTNYALDGNTSYLSNLGYTDGKYNYYNQSLGLFAALLITGAFPNVYSDLINPSAPTYVSCNIANNIYNKTDTAVNAIYSSTEGGGFVKSIDLKLTHSQGWVQIKFDASKQNTASIVSDPSGYIKSASAEKIITGNLVSVTFNILLNSAWTSGSVQLAAMATDHKGNSTAWQNLGAAKTYFNYPINYLATTGSVTLKTVTSSPTYKIEKLVDPITIASATTSWNLMAYTMIDTDPVGLRLITGNTVLNVLPLKIMLSDSPTLPTQWTSPSWNTVYDLRHTTKNITVLAGTTPLSYTNKYIFLGVDLTLPYQGYYSSDIYFNLVTNLDNNLISNFENGTTYTKYGTYFYPVALYTANTTTNTVASASLVANQFNNSKSLKLTYTLGSKNKPGSGAQATIGFDFNPSGNATNISSSKGISFWLKGNGHPLAVILKASTINTDSDFYLYTIPAPKNDWVKYNACFTEFKQVGFGAAKTLSSVLNAADGIQIGTLSEKEGESSSFMIDEIRLF